MEQDKPNANNESLNSRRKRINRIKISIVIIVIIFLLLPTILCIVMFFKVRSLQDQIDVLMIERYGVTYHEMFEKNHEGIAHAAVVKYNNSNNTKNLSNSDTNASLNQDSSNPSDLKDSLEDMASTDQAKSEGDLVTGQLEDASDEDKIVDHIEDENKEDLAADQPEDVLGEDLVIDDLERKLEDDLSSDKKSEDDQTDSSYKEYIFDSSKTVYLTFDDGPSKYTDDILDILDTYNVKATFFVIGKTDQYSKKMYKRIIEEGHTLAMHSYSHVYDKIYNSLEDFEKDFTKLSDLLYDTTGYVPSLYRFPGGSGNSVSKVDIQELIKFLKERSVVYFDWNVVNGDATGIKYSPEELYTNVMNGIQLHNTSIVLMHDTDTKENTVKSLEPILKTLTEQGVTILPLTNDVSPIQQVKEKPDTAKKK